MHTTMPTTLTSPPSVAPLAVRPGRAKLWIARILTSLIAAFLLFDAVAKLLAIAPVVDGTTKLGYGIGVIRPLGAVLTLSTLLYLFSRTRLLGAVLLTAYLGGATATLVRAGTPFWFPVAMGAFIWIAYTLRSDGLRALLLPNSSR